MHQHILVHTTQSFVRIAVAEQLKRDVPSPESAMQSIKYHDDGVGFMPRYPNVSDTPERYGLDGNLLCRNCEKPVAEGRRHYCSRKCMEEFNRNNSWFWVRKDVLRRDRYTCQICGKRFRKALLDVDHIMPVRAGVNPFDKDNLRTLCRECHRLKTKLDGEVL